MTSSSQPWTVGLMFNLLSHVPVSRGSFNFSKSGDSKYRTLCRAWANPLSLKYGPHYFPCWDLKKNFKTKATTRFLHNKKWIESICCHGSSFPFRWQSAHEFCECNISLNSTESLILTSYWRISLRQAGLTHLAGHTLSQKIFYMYNTPGLLPELTATQIQVASEQKGFTQIPAWIERCQSVPEVPSLASVFKFKLSCMSLQKPKHSRIKHCGLALHVNAPTVITTPLIL